MRIEVKVRPFGDRRLLQLQWVDPQTGLRKTRSAKTADPEQASLRRADLEYELNHGLASEPVRTTWQSLREAFEAEYYPGVRRNTRACYRRVFDLFERLANPGRLDAINARTISAFVASMRAMPAPIRGGSTGFKPSTISTHVQNLKAALRWANSMGMLDTVPAFPSVRSSPRTPQPVPAELAERLFAAADTQMRAWLLCGWLAGLRRNEAFGLEWEPSESAPWIDTERRRIVFPADAVKAGRDQWVPVAAELMQALQGLSRNGPHVFRFLDVRGQPLRAEAMTHRVEKLAARAKVRLTMRALRRGFGCRYAGKVPAQVLQRLLRHADISTTIAFYSNVDRAAEEAVFGADPHQHFDNSRVESAMK